MSEKEKGFFDYTEYFDALSPGNQIPRHLLLLGDQAAAARWIPWAKQKLFVLEQNEQFGSQVFNPHPGITVQITLVDQWKKITIKAGGGDKGSIYVLPQLRNTFYSAQNEPYTIWKPPFLKEDGTPNLVDGFNRGIPVSRDRPVAGAHGTYPPYSDSDTEYARLLTYQPASGKWKLDWKPPQYYGSNDWRGKAGVVSWKGNLHRYVVSPIGVTSTLLYLGPNIYEYGLVLATFSNYIVGAALYDNPNTGKFLFAVVRETGTESLYVKRYGGSTTSTATTTLATISAMAAGVSAPGPAYDDLVTETQKWIKVATLSTITPLFSFVSHWFFNQSATQFQTCRVGNDLVYNRVVADITDTSSVIPINETLNYIFPSFSCTEQLITDAVGGVSGTFNTTSSYNQTDVVITPCPPGGAPGGEILQTREFYYDLGGEYEKEVIVAADYKNDIPIYLRARFHRSLHAHVEHIYALVYSAFDVGPPYGCWYFFPVSGILRVVTNDLTFNDENQTHVELIMPNGRRVTTQRNGYNKFIESPTAAAGGGAHSDSFDPHFHAWFLYDFSYVLETYTANAATVVACDLRFDLLIVSGDLGTTPDPYVDIVTPKTTRLFGGGQPSDSVIVQYLYDPQYEVYYYDNGTVNVTTSFTPPTSFAGYEYHGAAVDDAGRFCYSGLKNVPDSYGKEYETVNYISHGDLPTITKTVPIGTKHLAYFKCGYFGYTNKAK